MDIEGCEWYVFSFQALEDELNYAQQVIECSKLIWINDYYENIISSLSIHNIIVLISNFYV